MSDNINIIGDKASFASNKEVAWHGLGQVVEGAMTSAEAIDLAGLNYTVKKGRIAMKYNAEDKERLNMDARFINDVFATYRSDTGDIFGTVGSKYEIVQNKDSFSFLDSIIGEGRAIYETAGALGLGETTFITCKLPYYIRINGHDTIENYLVISNSHNGKSSLNIFLTPIRIVCANTLALGKHVAKLSFKLRHTISIHDKIQDASILLNISKTISEETETMLKHLTTIKVQDKVADDYFNRLILNANELSELAKTRLDFKKTSVISTRKKNIITGIKKYYYTGVGQSSIVGTAYGLVNGVNGYLSNIKKFTNDSKRMESLVLGGTDFKLNNKALDLALNINN